MQRSGGITASAVVAIIGSVFFILLGLLIILAAVLSRSTLSAAADSGISPATSAMALARVSVLYIAMGVWGIVSAIGLLRLRNWARICTSIFGGILAFISLCCALVFILLARFMPQNLPPGNGTSPGVVAGVMSVFAVIAFLIAGTGVWWVFYFNRKHVKVQFLREGEELLPQQPPLSVSIIAWILIVGGVVILPQLLAPSPTLLFSFVVRGMVARLIYLLMASVSIVSGIGILKRIPEAYGLAVAYLCFSGGNGLAMFLIPGSHARRQNLLHEIQGNLPVILPMDSYLIIAMLIGFAGVCVGLWFLITRRQAFLDAAVE